MATRIEILGTAVSEARRFSERLAQAVEGAQIGDQTRQRVSRLLLQQAIEDGLAIPVLVHHRWLGSARALMRPLFEALARAAWSNVIAAPEHLEAFANGKKEPPSIGTLVDALIAHATGWVVSGTRIPFDGIWQRSKGAFHELTHRGTRAVARLSIANMGDGEYVGEDEFAVLLIAGSCAGIAAMALLEAAGLAERCAQVEAQIDDFRKRIVDLDQAASALTP